MSKLLSAICALIVVAVSAPAFATVHVIDQGIIRNAGGFPFFDLLSRCLCSCPCL
jgi:hypothetical protein